MSLRIAHSDTNYRTNSPSIVPNPAVIGRMKTFSYPKRSQGFMRMMPGSFERNFRIQTRTCYMLGHPALHVEEEASVLLFQTSHQVVEKISTHWIALHAANQNANTGTYLSGIVGFNRHKRSTQGHLTGPSALLLIKGPRSLFHSQGRMGSVPHGSCPQEQAWVIPPC